MRGKKTSQAVIHTIISLRKKGFSIKEIHLKLNKSKSLISHYIKGVEILPQYINLWKLKKGASKQRSLEAWAKAKNIAESFFSSPLSSREKILIIACLYWGEGGKNSDFNLSNTDPNLIKIFIEYLKELGIEKNRLKINIRIYEDMNPKKVINYWAKVIGINPKKILGVNILKGKKNGKLKYGMCRIRITKGGFVLKTIMSIISTLNAFISPRSLTDKTAHS